MKNISNNAKLSLYHLRHHHDYACGLGFHWRGGILERDGGNMLKPQLAYGLLYKNRGKILMKMMACGCAAHHIYFFNFANSAYALLKIEKKKLVTFLAPQLGAYARNIVLPLGTQILTCALEATR